MSGAALGIVAVVLGVVAGTTPTSSGVTGRPGASSSSGGSGVLAALLAGPDPCIAVLGRTAASYRQCWEERFAALATSEGIPAALASVQELGATFPEILNNCHEYKHRIGRAAAEVVGDPTAAFAYDDRTCQYGYRHGVLEAFAAHSDERALVDAMGQMCVPFHAVGMDYLECLHGLGHAASVFQPHDLVKAITYCDDIGGGTDEDRRSCAGGAFMEYANSYVLAKTGIGVADPLGPGQATIDDESARQLCTKVPERYLDECWRRIGLFWGPVLLDDFAAMLRRCDADAGTDRRKGFCANSVGEWAMRQATGAVRRDVHPTPEQNLALALRTVDMCSRGPTTLIGSCLYGAVGPMRRNDMWQQHPASEWVQVCDVAPAVAQGACRDGERDAADSVSRIPDAGARAEARAPTADAGVRTSGDPAQS